MLREALARPLESTDFRDLGQMYAGKVRDNYTSNGRRYIVTTDRISALARLLGTLPIKGQVLQWMTSFWFEASADLVPTPLLSARDPIVMLVRECTPLGAEMVMRAYITGVTGTSI